MIISYVTSINQLCLKNQFMIYIEDYEEILDTYLDRDTILRAKLPTPKWLKDYSSEAIIRDISREVHILKSLIELNKKAIKKYLPLKPYLDFLKEAEKEVKNDLKELAELLRRIYYSISPDPSLVKKESVEVFINGYNIDYSKIDVYISNEEIKNYIVR